MLPFRDYWSLLSRYLRPQWARALLMALLLLLSIALQLFNPQVLSDFIDMVSRQAALRLLVYQALLFLGVAIVAQLLTLAVTYLAENVAWTAVNALRATLTHHVLRLDMGFHKTHTPGELIERIDGDVNMLGNFFSQLFVRVIGNGLLAVGVLALLFGLHWYVGLTGLLYAALTLALLRTLRRRSVRAWSASRETYADFSGFAGERIYGTEDLRPNGAVPHVLHQFYHYMRRVYRAWLNAKVVQSLGHNAGALLYLLAQVAALGLGALLFRRAELTIGGVYLVAHYVTLLRAPMDRIQREVADLRRAGAGIERVQSLLKLTPRIANARGISSAHRVWNPLSLPHARSPEAGKQLPAGALAVTCRGVSFYYQDELPATPEMSVSPEETGVVLDDVSFHLEPGQVLGLLGRTGSGKTTLARLLARLYDPVQGTIHVGGVHLRAVAPLEVHERVSLVTQDVQVFRATVRDNVALFDRDVDDAAILHALEVLGLRPWYDELPEGLDTRLEGGGRSLSAGEAQLLALARAFLRDPGLVILDEASARLDPETEQLLERAMTRLLEGRTGVIIAHRLATVERADEILILSQGRAVEQGMRASLAAAPQTRFARLLRGDLEEVLA